MIQITYEQFVAWCKHWNYTIDEAYKAMCFTSNIIGQYFINCIDRDKEEHSEAYAKLIKKEKESATTLVCDYGKLNNAVFEMLKQHTDNVKYSQDDMLVQVTTLLFLIGFY